MVNFILVPQLPKNNITIGLIYHETKIHVYEVRVRDFSLIIGRAPQVFFSFETAFREVMKFFIVVMNSLCVSTYCVVAENERVNPG